MESNYWERRISIAAFTFPFVRVNAYIYAYLLLLIDFNEQSSKIKYYSPQCFSACQ